MRWLPLFVIALVACCATAREPRPKRATDLACLVGEHLHGFTQCAPLWRLEGEHLEHASYGGLGEPLRIECGGRFTSMVLGWERPFDELLCSWNAVVPQGACLTVEVAVGDAAGLSPWLYLGDWNRGGEALERPLDERIVEFDGGAVEVDILRGERLFDRWRYRLTVSGRSDAPVEVHRTVFVLTDARRLAELIPEPPSSRAAQASLSVPTLSQRTAPPELAPRICSPTSVAMVLAHAGIECTQEEVAALLYDRVHDLYGNWPRAVQGAFELGAPGALVRLSSWRAVEQFLRTGVPLVISVGAGEGELRGAPFEQTSGHLLVLTGFDSSGDVRVNDPAAEPGKVARTYRREDLERCWMRRGGLAYVIGD